MLDNTPLTEYSGVEFCYLTTTGRVSGLPREIEIWFGVNGPTLYMLSGDRKRSNWLRNFQLYPDVTVRISGALFNGAARVIDEQTDEASMVRRLIFDKYQPIHEGDLTDPVRTALPVAIDIREYTDQNGDRYAIRRGRTASD